MTLSVRSRVFHFGYDRWWRYRKAGHRVRKTIWGWYVSLTVTDLWREDWKEWRKK